MNRIAAKVARAATNAVASSHFTLFKPLPVLPPSFYRHASKPLPPPSLLLLPSLSAIRNFSSSDTANPITLQMINYAFSLARSQKSDDSFAQSLLVLEQCYSCQSDDNSKGMVLLAMSTLLSERENFGDAIEKLKRIQDLSISFLSVKVAATEALVKLHLELGQDDTASVFASICLQLLEAIEIEMGSGPGSETLVSHIKASKGLVELVHGNTVPAALYFGGAESEKDCVGDVALSYGLFLHAKGNFTMAREWYRKVIQGITSSKDITDPYILATHDMFMDEVLLAATCALGQLEAHLGNFNGAEESLTAALKKAEEHFGSNHPKVGVILTCIALMFRNKAAMERSSSILIQEGLYRKALELLKAPSLDIEGGEANVHRRDIVALARGGYAEILCIQQNRKGEGERMKRWAENVWTNRRLSLAEALETSESSSKKLVIDARISRAL